LLAPCVLVTLFAGIVLVYVLGVAPVTWTEIVHVAPAGSVPAASDTFVPAAAAVTVPEPQVVAALGSAAMVTPAGKASDAVKLESATLPVPVFASVMVRVEIALGEIEAGANAVLSVRLGADATLNPALALATFVAPCVVVSAPAAIVFV
jgi:hypothetical protein